MDFRRLAPVAALALAVAITIGACATQQPPTPTATATQPTVIPTLLAQPDTWRTVAETTWEVTFHITLEVWGASMVQPGQPVLIRTRVENVSASPAQYTLWSSTDPAVPLWIVTPVGSLIQLVEPLTNGGFSLPTVGIETLQPGESVEREIAWDGHVFVDGQRVPAPDDVYTIRADFFPGAGVGSPAQAPVVLTHEITVEENPNSTATVEPDSTSLIPLGDSFELQPGQRALVSGIGMVTFLRVIEDSRCPEDVTCVWAGRVVLTFALGETLEEMQAISPSGAADKGIASGDHGAYRITVIDLLPHPHSERTIEPDDYVTTSVVTLRQ